MKHLRDLFLLRPGITYLNHGSFGACPKPVFETYQNWQLELEREPVEFLGRRFPELMYEARRALAKFLHTGVDDLLFVTNASTGLNYVAHSLPLESGDEVLATDQEYGAMDRMWEMICHRSGARYIRQPLPLPLAGSPEEIAETIWSGVSERTKILFISHITSATALTLPVFLLSQRARQAGIWLVVDGAHGPGQIDLELTASGVDFYAGNCHKWMMAPKGAAFLYVRPELQHLIRPLIISWADFSRAQSRFVQENEFQGTRDIAAYLSVPAAISFMKDHHWAEVRRQCHQLVLHARERMSQICGLAPLTPGSRNWIQQMVAQQLPEGIDGEKLRERLFKKYAIEIPVNEINGKEYIRISVQGYNTDSDVENFLQAFDELRREMAESS